MWLMHCGCFDVISWHMKPGWPDLKRLSEITSVKNKRMRNNRTSKESYTDRRVTSDSISRECEALKHTCSVCLCDAVGCERDDSDDDDDDEENEEIKEELSLHEQEERGTACFLDVS